jgi:hypothetical protein
LEPKFRLRPVIASQVSLRLEDRNRDKRIGGMVTRKSGKDNENTEIPKIGPPARNSKAQKKKVAISDEVEEIPRDSEIEESRPKAKVMPYVDVPPLKATVRKPINDSVENQMTKIGPAYRSRAPVEIGIDIENIVERVMDLELTVPLRNLAGISGAVQKEIRKQVTRARTPIENEGVGTVTLQTSSSPMVKLEDVPVDVYTISMVDQEDIPIGSLVAGDPVLQYLSEHKDVLPENLVVADTSTPLRSIYMTVNRTGPAECLVDNGSSIVSMSKAAAVQHGLTWDPMLSINMESATNHVERTLGMSRNVRFATANITAYLQVHILGNPPYHILLGRPFETITGCISKAQKDGSSELTLTDPNTKAVSVVPTYRRGTGPEGLQKQSYQGF